MQSFSKIIRPPLFIPQPSIHKVEKGQKYPELSPFPSPSISPSLCPSLPLSLSLYLPPSIPRFLHHSLSSLFLSFSEHFASLVKKCLLPMGIYCSIKKSACYIWGFYYFFQKKNKFWKLKLDFFPLKKVFENFCSNILNHLSIN